MTGVGTGSTPRMALAMLLVNFAAVRLLMTLHCCQVVLRIMSSHDRPFTPAGALRRSKLLIPKRSIPLSDEQQRQVAQLVSGADPIDSSRARLARLQTSPRNTVGLAGACCTPCAYVPGGP
jgi:hypothetical protein